MRAYCASPLGRQNFHALAGLLCCEQRSILCLLAGRGLCQVFVEVMRGGSKPRPGSTTEIHVCNIEALLLQDVAAPRGGLAFLMLTLVPATVHSRLA